MVAAISRISNRTNTPPQPEGGDEESDISVLIARLTAEVDQIALREDPVDPANHQPDENAGAERADRKLARRLARAGFAVVAQEVRSVGQKVETSPRVWKPS